MYKPARDTVCALPVKKNKKKTYTFSSCCVFKMLRQRVLRRCEVESGKRPEFVAKRANTSTKWKIDPIPRRLQNRKLDLGDISPARLDLLVAALNSDVQGIQVRFYCVGLRR